MTVKRVIALILVIAIMGAGVFFLRRMEKDDQRHMNELYDLVEPLQKQREALVAERDSLEVDYALMMRDTGTAQLLFRELSDTLYTEVYPLMRDRNIVGVLGISMKEIPGARHKIAVDQYNRLLMDGWGSCLVFKDDWKSFTYWYEQISKDLNKAGVAVPTAVFFPDNTYDQSLDEELIALGITTVVVSASDGHSSTVTPVDGELWFTGAMPWNYTGVNSDTNLLALTNGANLTFTVSFADLWDAYEKVSFTRILDNWESMLYVEDPLEDLLQPTPTPNPADPEKVETPADQLLKPMLKPASYEAARAAHQAADEANSRLEAELKDRQAALNEQIAALDEQISELYAQWNDSASHNLLDDFLARFRKKSE